MGELKEIPALGLPGEVMDDPIWDYKLPIGNYNSVVAFIYEGDIVCSLHFINPTNDELRRHDSVISFACHVQELIKTYCPTQQGETDYGSERTDQGV